MQKYLHWNKNMHLIIYNVSILICLILWRALKTILKREVYVRNKDLLKVFTLKFRVLLKSHILNYTFENDGSRGNGLSQKYICSTTVMFPIFFFLFKIAVQIIHKEGDKQLIRTIGVNPTLNIPNSECNKW